MALQQSKVLVKRKPVLPQVINALMQVLKTEIESLINTVGL